MAEIEMLMVRRDGGGQGGDIRGRNGGSGGGGDGHVRVEILIVKEVMVVEVVEMVLEMKGVKVGWSYT